MPPKKSKKPKKSKEELEAEKAAREAEEAKEREAERIRLEAEAKKQEEFRLAQVAETKRKRGIELEKLNAEYKVHHPKVEARVTALNAALKSTAEALAWKKYVDCGVRPDASNVGEINSFINTWAAEEEPDLQNSINSCEYAYHVIQDLESVLANAQSNSSTITNPIITQTSQFIHHLQTIIRDKLNYTSARTMLFADEMQADKNEVRLSYASSNIKAGIYINLATKGFRAKKVEFPTIKVSVDLPKTIAVLNAAVRVTHVPYDDVGSTTTHDTLGGVFTVDLLQNPVPAKKVKGWVRRDISAGADNSVKIVPVAPADGNTASSSIKVTLTLPSNLILPNPLRVGWYNSDLQKWEEDGVSDVMIDEEDSELLVLSLTTVKLSSALAVIQDRDLNFTKLSWNLTVTHDRICDTSVATLCLVTSQYSKIVLSISSVDGLVTLTEPQLPQLKDLKSVAPGEFMKRLAAAGINLCPSTNDDVVFNKTDSVKDSTLEEMLVKEVCTIASGFEVSSHDPATMNNDKSTLALFRVRELLPMSLVSTTEDPDELDLLREPYYHVMATMDEEVETTSTAEKGNPVIKFRMMQKEDTFDTCLYLRNALESVCTTSTTDMDEMDVMFERAIGQVLRLVRPFSYCHPESPEESTVSAASSSLNEVILSKEEYK